MSNNASTSQTTHADRVAGWIVLCLFVAGLTGMFLAVFAPHIPPASQASLLSISSSVLGAIAGSLTLRRSNPTPDSSQQVTIPSQDGTAPVTVTNTTGAAVQPVVIASPPPAGDPGAGE